MFSEALFMRTTYKSIGCCILAFGAGILLSVFLPPAVIVCIEAAVIISVGFLFLRK